MKYSHNFINDYSNVVVDVEINVAQCALSFRFELISIHKML